MLEAEKRDLAASVQQVLLKTLQRWLDANADCSVNRPAPVNLAHVKLKNTDMGAIEAGRILVAFSYACNRMKRQDFKERKQYLELARKAYVYLSTFFVDREYGWIYKSVAQDGRPVNTQKQAYHGSYMIYGCAEYYRASQDEEALQLAIDLFRTIDRFAWDQEKAGYWNEFSREFRLPDTGTDRKILNDQMHMLEACTALYRVWPDEKLKERLRSLLDIMIEKVWQEESRSVCQTFDRNFRALSWEDNYGDDCEAAWLMAEAAEVLQDDRYLSAAEKILEKTMEHVLKEGMDPVFGGVYSGKVRSETDDHKVWWTQCEALNSLSVLYMLTGRERLLDTAGELWNFIFRYLVDQDSVWHWQVKRDGTADPQGEREIRLMCPYHNTRACLKLISALEYGLK